MFPAEDGVISLCEVLLGSLFFEESFSWVEMLAINDGRVYDVDICCGRSA